MSADQQPLTFPPYTLTGGVAYRDIEDGTVLEGTDCAVHPQSGQLSPINPLWIGKVFNPRDYWQFRRPLAPTPDNYRAMQTAWLSHVNVGVGSRVRCVNDVDTVWNSFGFTAEFPRGVSVIEFHSKCQWPELVVTGIEPHGIRCKDCSWLFPFHVLAPVPEQPNVEVIELTDLTRGWDVPMGVTHLVEVPLPGEGEVWPKDRYVSRHGEQWFSMDWAIGKTVDGTLTPGRYKCARRAEPHEHPHAVPEGQGRPSSVGIADFDPSFPASPTPAIERGEEEPWFVVRNWSDGCEKCPDIYSGKQWIATVVGAPHLGHDSLERAELIVKAVNAYRNAPTPTPSAGQEVRYRNDGGDLWIEGLDYNHPEKPHTYTGIGVDRELRHSKSARDLMDQIVASLNASPVRLEVLPTPTPSAGQEEDDRFIEEEQTVLRLHDKEVTARWVDGVRSELGGDGSLVYLVRLLQKELADLRRQVADDDRLQCCNGCRHYTGGDVRHHPSCKWYPESLTKMQDQQEQELTRLRGEVERLESWKRQAIEVDFPRQEIAKALNIPLGQAIHGQTLPAIQRLTADLGRAREALREARALFSMGIEANSDLTTFRQSTEIHAKADRIFAVIDASLRPAAKDDEGGAE